MGTFPIYGAFDIKDALKGAGCRWNPAIKAWVIDPTTPSFEDVCSILAFHGHDQAAVAAETLDAVRSGKPLPEVEAPAARRSRGRWGYRGCEGDPCCCDGAELWQECVYAY